MSNQGEQQHSAIRDYLYLEYGDEFEKAAAAARIEGKIEGKIRGEMRGELKGEIRGILRIRRLSMTAVQAERLDQADTPTLRRWLDRAPSAPTVDAVFEEPS